MEKFLVNYSVEDLFLRSNSTEMTTIKILWVLSTTRTMTRENGN